MQDLNIRPSAPEDFHVLDAIRAAAFAPVFASFRSLVGAPIAAAAFHSAEREQQDHLSNLLKPGDGRIMLVAEKSGVARGFCAVSWNAETGIGEIGLNAVHPSTQRHGIARRLYTAALDRMRDEGMRVALVGTGGDESHASARAAYGAAGFTAAVPSLHLYRLL